MDEYKYCLVPNKRLFHPMLMQLNYSFKPDREQVYNFVDEMEHFANRKFRNSARKNNGFLMHSRI